MGIGVWELLLVFLMVLLIFGTKKLKSIGGDLGGAIRSFRTAMNEPDAGSANREASPGEDVQPGLAGPKG